MLAERVAAIGEYLELDERDRVLAIAPSFARAVAANDPDLVQMVAMLLQMSPGFAALWLRAHLDLLERRFAS